MSNVKPPLKEGFVAADSLDACVDDDKRDVAAPSGSVVVLYSQLGQLMISCAVGPPAFENGVCLAVVGTSWSPHSEQCPTLQLPQSLTIPGESVSVISKASVWSAFIAMSTSPQRSHFKPSRCVPRAKNGIVGDGVGKGTGPAGAAVAFSSTLVLFFPPAALVTVAISSITSPPALAPPCTSDSKGTLIFLFDR